MMNVGIRRVGMALGLVLGILAIASPGVAAARTQTPPTSATLPASAPASRPATKPAARPATAAARPAPAPAARKPAGPLAADEKGLYNVSQIDLGATAKGSGAPFNKDWPAINALNPQVGGTMIGAPMKGGRVDVRLIVPVEVVAVELLALDYNGTEQPNGVDIFVEGKLLKHMDLPETPGKPHRIELDAPVKGQTVSILITGEHPVRTLADGRKGPNYGGWKAVRVLSSTNVAELMKDVEQYSVPVAAANIAPTAGAAVGEKVEVVGQPRETKGHPNTIWDAEDIAHYKEMLGTSKELQAQYAGLKKAMDERITQAIDVPQPKKGNDGKWLHFSDAAVYNGSTYGAVHNQNCLDIANLATMYALSGDAKYAEFCKKMLVAYADAFPNYGVGARQGFSHDPSKVYDQRLGDATWGIQVARGYDLIYNLPSITPEERRHIEDDLLKALAWHIIGNHATVEAPTNWSAIDTCCVLMCGYAADDSNIIDTAFWGIRGTKEKPTGGLFDRHFGAKAIADDSLWSEGAMGYQFMALEALIADAEILWHHGIDMYRYRDCALKRVFDSPLRICYPDLTTPATHDSGHGSILSGESFLYEFAYRRYRDPIYLNILNQAGMHLDAQFQKFPVSVLYDRDRSQKAPPLDWKSVNFFNVGYGIERLTTPAGTTSLLMDYGPAGSHGHPDKLNIDLYALGDRLIPDPGSVWYEQPIYQKWYHPTFSHNTLNVDELSQKMCGADLVVYAPADTFAMQRARTNQAYAGVMMDRSLFMTPNYVADIFGAFARLPRKMDLVYHIRGEFASDLKMSPMEFAKPAEVGYSELTNVRHAETDKPWNATVTVNGNPARFVAAGGAPTDVIAGDGILGIEKPPTIIERRNAASTVFGNVIDISGSKDGAVSRVVLEGGLDQGYAMMTVWTKEGVSRDGGRCFVSYRPGTYKVGNMETDAQQVFTTVDSLYMAGGTFLKVVGGSISRSEPGLAYIETTETGGYVVGNPSPTDATVTLAFKFLDGLEAYELDATGKRAGQAEARLTAGLGIRTTMKAGAKIEFAPKGAQSVYDFRQAMLKKRQEEQEKALAKAKEEAIARDTARQAEAAAKPAPAGTMIVVQAEDFSAMGDGNVTITEKKRAAIGKAIIQWDGAGQWLEWTIDAPAEGYYNLTLCYCSELDLIAREIKVNGVVQEPFATVILPSTGGWAGGSDDWRLWTAKNPVNDKPLLIKFKQGKNVLRLTNLNGRGSNLDWLAVTSPDVKPDREALAKKLK